jgi:hypothetical protein
MPDDDAADERYDHRTDTLRSLFNEAKARMPGGNTRSGVCHDSHPTYEESGDGCYVSDVEVQRIPRLRHQHEVADPRRRRPGNDRAGNRGHPCEECPGGPTRTEIEFAEHVHDCVPGLVSIRFTTPGRRP